MTAIVTAGRTRGASGGWVRPLGAPGRVLVPTVAHILYDSAGRLRSEVRLGDSTARVHAVVELPRRRSSAADAALIEPDAGWAGPRFEPARGHLNAFVPGLRVRCRLPEGSTMTGRLARAGWSGRMAYNFGARRVTGQWIVSADHRGDAQGTRPLRRGDSGLLWATEDGVSVGLQIGTLSGRPYEAIVTPLDMVCRMFGVRAAA